ncbi:MAG: PhzF family phenazine biosynthesis protein [Alphaproteobacteria bacterium]
MRYRFYTADVFTDRIFGGNQLAVFPAGRGLETARMQAVAAEFNIAETVFVLPPEDPAHTRRLRIFTPRAELPFAGHPTIGTAHVLAATGEIDLAGETTRIVFEEGVGPVPVTIRAAGGKPVSATLTAAAAPEIGPAPPPAAELAAMLSLDEGDVLGGDHAPEAIASGPRFVFVPLADRGAVGRARIDPALWQRLLAGFWAPNVYVFAFDAELAGSDVRARMFAPALGIAEDPATGAAATALAAYLGVRDARADGTLRWVVEQGFEMGRPALLEVEADKAAGEVAAIRVGGSSVMVSEGEMEIPR